MKFTSRSLLLIWIFLLAALLLTRGRTLAQACNPATLQNCIVTGGVTPAAQAPAPGEAYTAQTAGLVEYSKTDLTIAAPIPIEVTRTLSVVSSNTACSNYLAGDFVFACNTQPLGDWFNAKINWDAGVPGGGGWDLTRKDGTVYKFGARAPLQSINDRYDNSITLTRAGVSGDSQRGNVTTITASNGRSLTLDYSGSPGNCCITGYGMSGGGDPAGREITYAYNNREQLTTVAYPKINAQAEINYTWVTGHPNFISLIGVKINSSQIDYVNLSYNFTNDYLTALYPGNGSNPDIGVQYSYKTSGEVISDVTATFPDGSTRDLFPNTAGYITKDVRNSSAAAAKRQTFAYTRDTTTNLITEVQEQEDPLGRYTNYTYDSDGVNDRPKFPP